LTESPRALRLPAHPLGRQDILRWLYIGRLTLVTGILVGALRVWFAADPQDTLVAIIVFLVAVGVTSGSFWYTHVLGREPSHNFLYAQVVLDVMIVTAIVHITNGPESSFAPAYILVISSGALLLPLPGGALIAGLASMVYFADLAWGFQESFSLNVALQIGLFTVVAIITGLLGDRLRQAGLALGAVASELRQLRLDTGDILANLATGVVTVDGSGLLVYSNPAARGLLGTDLQSRLGKPILEELERVAPGMGGVLEGSIRDQKSVARFRTTAMHPGRKNTRLRVSTTVLERADGAKPSATAIFQDITDLERVDELNRRTERLEAVAALSASLAHEIKNPLASIRSAVEQLGGGGLAEADRGTLERLVLEESDRLSRLLSEFLEYSVLKIGAREEVDMAQLARDCLALGCQHPDLEEVEVRTEIPEGRVRVLGDADLLHRALFNLLLNGAQSAGPGGVVTVVVTDAPQRFQPLGADIEHPVQIAVRDSGSGVEPDVARRIFDPFFTTKKSGSGLGLAIVHRAVEAHAGATLVDRAPEGGAEFVIVLPGLPGSDPRGAE
jgi:two-component system, NtrC family, sensor histidine kinase PilS